MRAVVKTPEVIAADLAEKIGSNAVSAAQAERVLHSRDQSSHPAVVPQVVAWPSNTADVSAILRYANADKISIVGWGAGTSLEGNTIPLNGGIVVNFQRMNQVLALHAEDFQVTVQPGLFYKDMNRDLRRQGLFFAPDPGANASIGGMIANNAAGTRTPKHGATRDNVLALEVVLADGRVVRTGSRSIKQSAGYDLTHLFVGSEGTLGLITEATIQLAPIPEHSSAALVAFNKVAEAADAVYGIIGYGLLPTATELMDLAAMRYINTIPGIDLPELPHLFIEFDAASPVSLASDLALVEEICHDSGCVTFEAGVSQAERDRLWEGRHSLFEAMLRVHPGETYLISDVSVPISAYPEIVTAARDLMDELDLSGAVFGHAADGNVHTITFGPPEDEGTATRMKLFNEKVVEKAIELDGTCTGEHGIGIGKQKYLALELGQATVELMRATKAAFDPYNILNPGKIF